jgi:predicted dehydrogenase
MAKVNPFIGKKKSTLIIAITCLLAVFALILSQTAVAAENEPAAAQKAQQSQTPAKPKIRVGIYGSNNHQIQGELVNNPRAELVATAAFETRRLPKELQNRPEIRNYNTLDELLADERVQLVSLCSPKRSEQAREAIRCMEAGKHVYAEKPCAMTEEDLDAIIATSKKTGMQFHDQAGTALGHPYYEMRKIVEEGTLGEVVQIFAQKSYPMNNTRPQDEDVDGGLLMQAGVHAMRFVEHVGGVKVKSIEAIETQLGNPKEGDLRMACVMTMTLENGGLATIIANYLNSPKFGSWGNEHLRIWGTKGFVESVDAGKRTRLVLNTEDKGELQRTRRGVDFFDAYMRNLQEGTPMPFTMEEELHPTRMVIQAKKNAMSRLKP